MLYPILLSDGKTEIPVCLIDLMYLHSNLCDAGKARSHEAMNLKRQIEIGLSALGMKWKTEHLALCGHPHHASYSETKFFISPDVGHEYYGQRLMSYEEACKAMDEGNQKYKEMCKYSDVAQICAMTKEDLEEL